VLPGVSGAHLEVKAKDNSEESLNNTIYKCWHIPTFLSQTHNQTFKKNHYREKTITLLTTSYTDL